MLQQIDKRTKRLLDLADYIEKSETFSQGNWHECICGHAVKLYGGFFNGRPSHDAVTGTTGYIEWGAKTLGMTYNDACDMFGSGTLSAVTREQAASVVRHYALTGKVDWGRVARRGQGHDHSHREVLPLAEPVHLSDVGAYA